MRYIVRESLVWAIGPIWWPVGAVCSQVYELSDYDLENIRGSGTGKIDRDSVARWLDTHAGDFQSVTDFRASIEDGDQSIEIEWADEESELAYSDTLPQEE
jgi:hypothetical protein